MIQITREKHLDHMVRVVPFVVTCYFIQCFVILNVGKGDLATLGLSILGGLLALMIGAFVTYDLKHSVTLTDDHLTISFLGRTTTVPYKDVTSIEIEGNDQSFATLTVKVKAQRHSFYFIDNPKKIKDWIEQRKDENLKSAA